MMTGPGAGQDQAPARLKLTPEIALTIVRRHRDGERTEDLAKSFDVSVRTIRAAVRALAGGARQKPGKKVNPERDAAILEAYESGQSTIQIAEQFGLTAPTVKWAVVRAGGTLRTRKGAMQLAYQTGRRRKDLTVSAETKAGLAKGYQDGKTVDQLVIEFDVSSRTLYHVLRVQGVAIRNPDYSRFDSPERDGEIRRLYESGANTHELGERFHLSAHAVSAAIRRAGGTMRTVSEARRLEVTKGVQIGPTRGPTGRKSAELEEAVCQGYQAGRTSWDLAAEFKIGSETVLRILRRHGIPIRRGGAPGGLSPERQEVARARFKDGATIRALARDFGVSRSAVRNAVKTLLPSHQPQGPAGSLEGIL